MMKGERGEGLVNVPPLPIIIIRSIGSTSHLNNANNVNCTSICDSVPTVWYDSHDSCKLRLKS